MDKIKIAIGLVIIVASFVYILRNKGSMLDNLLAKSKKEYEQRQAIKEKALKAVGGETKEEREEAVNEKIYGKAAKPAASRDSVTEPEPAASRETAANEMPADESK